MLATECYRHEPPDFNSAAYDLDDATNTTLSGHTVLCDCDRCQSEAVYRDDVWFVTATGQWRKVKSPWAKGKIPAWLAAQTDPTPFTSLRPIGTAGRGKSRLRPLSTSEGWDEPKTERCSEYGRDGFVDRSIPEMMSIAGSAKLAAVTIETDEKESGIRAAASWSGPPLRSLVPAVVAGLCEEDGVTAIPQTEANELARQWGEFAGNLRVPDCEPVRDALASLVALRRSPEDKDYAVIAAAADLHNRMIEVDREYGQDSIDTPDEGEPARSRKPRPPRIDHEHTKAFRQAKAAIGH